MNAFRLAFGEDHDGCLIFRIMHLDEQSKVAHQCAEAERTIPNFQVLRRVLNEEEIARLLRACDYHVSAHPSDGFGFTVAEAMALGQSATDYGSRRDFVSAATAFSVNYWLTGLGRHIGTYAAGVVWAADPSADALAQAMRQVVQEPVGAQCRARIARETIGRKYSLAALAWKVEA